MLIRLLNPILGDPATSVEEAMEFLKQLSAQANEIKKNAQDYNKYQQAMGLAVTRFEDVDELTKDVLLKNLLWETKVKWTSVTEIWCNRTFASVDPNAMGDEIREYQIAAARVSKGLSSNLVALDFRSSVQEYASLMPVVQDLKNPALKKRNQDDIIALWGGFNIFSEEPIKFGKLFELRAFDYVEKITAISSQATNDRTFKTCLPQSRS